ncbi:DUF3631 domain-containing protein [Amycolatopsis nigrescens]|uniref:DUF3631 domain-containing protein n=1 Tax=Amycolatopsis nigrescens TaxID=381445 RepID=UPI00037D2A16|nr:DUF3631 domain-containing protein [Amycolatopsis nigrescens]
MKIDELDATIDGAALLDEARDLLVTYCALPTPEAADAIVLWCAATHALETLPFAPRLSVRSATKRSGKTRVLDVVTLLSHRPLKTVNATVPAIFRSLGGEHPPTLIFDEADTIFGSKKVAENNEDLRGLLNAGFERGAPSLRCVGQSQTPVEFPSFAMAALAGIGSLPDTIEDRSVIIHMRRRKPSEIVKPFRILRDKPAIEAVGTRLAAWLTTEDTKTVLSHAEPKSDLEDRAADVWEPLLMVADLAGADWPQRARTAAKRLLEESAEDERENSLPVQLLHDMRRVFAGFKGDWVATENLVRELWKVDESPWSEMELTAHKLGRMLSHFGIKSDRNKDRAKRGYNRRDFADAWERYPSDEDTADAADVPRRPVQPSEVSRSVQTSSDQAKQPDALPDALDGPAKASGEASRRSRRSGPVRTLQDGLDANPDAIDRAAALLESELDATELPGEG